MSEHPSKQSSSSVHSAELDRALAEYCDLVDRGELVDREPFLQRFPPEVRHELEQCLGAFDFIHDATPSTRESFNAEIASPDWDATDEQASFRLGDYQIIREIGRGGMGVVYEAEQISLHRRVAVKVLPFAGLLDRRQLDRFRNEARAAAMLKHPNIVSVLSVGHEEGVHFYAMELVEGCSLADVFRWQENVDLDRRKASELDRHPGVIGRDDTTAAAQLSTERIQDRHQFFKSVARLGIQAANSLAFAHDAGVIHRDIKPANLLLDLDGTLQVTDFGLARIQSDQGVTMTGDVLGTLRYMSPEQIDEKRVVDHRTDIYSLGLTLYELVAGKPAYTSGSRAALAADIVAGNIMPLRNAYPDVPRDLETIIQKAVEPAIDSRYQNASELEADLQRFTQGQPVLARRVGTVERAVRWCLRNRSKAALLGVMATLLLALAIGGPLVALQQTAIAAKQRYEAYDAAMARAHEHIEMGEIDQAVAILREYLPESDDGSNDYRSFEFFEMVQRCKRRIEADELRFLLPIWNVAIAPNGDLAVTTYHRGPVVYNSRTLELKWEADSPFKLQYGLAFSADGRFLLSGGSDAQLRVWNAATGELLDDTDTGIKIGALAVSSKNEVALSEWGETRPFPSEKPMPIKRYKLDVHDEDVSIRTLPSMDGCRGPIRSLQFHPNGAKLASGSEDGFLRIWNVQDANVEFAHQMDGPVMAVAFSDDGSRVCAAGGIYQKRWLSGHAVIVDLHQKRTVANVFPDDAVWCVDFASNDTLITGDASRAACVWDVENEVLIEKINAHADTITCVAKLPHQNCFATGASDNTVRIWNLDEPPPPNRLADPNAVEIFDVAFSPNGKRLASTSGDREISIWDPLTGELVKKLAPPRYFANSIDFSPDGSHLAISGQDPNPGGLGELRIYDVASGNFEGFVGSEIGANNGPRFVAYGPGGHHIAFIYVPVDEAPDGIASANERLALWNVAERKIDAMTSVQNGFHIKFSKDGKYVGTPAGLWRYPSLEPVELKTDDDQFSIRLRDPPGEQLRCDGRIRNSRNYSLRRQHR